MPVLDGFNIIERLSKEFPNVNTNVCSSHNENSKINKLIMLGARCHLPKNIEFNKTVEIINKINNEGYYFDATISKMVIDTIFKQKLYQLQIDEIRLTKRELEILELVCMGESNPKIACKLKIASSNVFIDETFIKNMYKSGNRHSEVYN